MFTNKTINLHILFRVNQLKEICAVTHISIVTLTIEWFCCFNIDVAAALFTLAIIHLETILCFVCLGRRRHFSIDVSISLEKVQSATISKSHYAARRHKWWFANAFTQTEPTKYTLLYILLIFCHELIIEWSISPKGARAFMWSDCSC